MFSKNNIINGNGYMVWMDTCEKYIGQWANNLQNGLGIHIWYELKGEQKYLRNRYVGEWRQGFRHGYGVFFYSNGSKYEGQWDQNHKHGFGVYTFHDGSQYIGRFQNDRTVDFNPSGFISAATALKSKEIKEVPNVTATTSFKPNSTKLKIGQTPLNNNNKQLTDISENISKISVNNEQQTTKDNGQISKDTLLNISQVSNNNNNLSGKKEELKSKIFPSLNIKELKPINTLEIIQEGVEEIAAPINNNNANKNSKQNTIISKNQDNAFLNTLNNQNLLNTQFNASASDTLMATNNKTITSNRIIKESEMNPFKQLLDISDIIECEPDIENCLKEVENILLRNLSDMKMWYRVYTNKDTGHKENLDYTNLNQSILPGPESSAKNNTLVGDSYIMSQMGNFDLGTSINLNSNFKKKPSNNNVFNPISNIKENKEINYKDNVKDSSNNKEKENLNPVHPSNLETVYNNDLGFAMEMKDLWKFLRDCRVISSDFTIAQFNRLFFKGSKNYLEMFMCREDLDQSQIYDYVYLMLNKAKEDFTLKYREKIMINEADNKRAEIKEIDNNQHSENLPSLVYKQENLEINIDIHNKRQTVLLRQFYDAIVRISYLKFFDSDMSLNLKLQTLIDQYIKTNPNFKRSKRSVNMNESIINSSVVFDLKIKTFETSYEAFLINFELFLKNMFDKLYFRSTTNVKKYDQTLTYRFLFNTLILKYEKFTTFCNKINFIDMINMYHKDKKLIGIRSVNDKQTLNYIETLYDCELIFFEFCEVIFICCKKYLISNSYNDIKENYSDILSDLMLIVENIENELNNEDINQTSKVSFPKLQHHILYENIIEIKRQKEEEEIKKEKENRRINFERKMMDLEDLNALPEEIEESKQSNSMSDEYSEEGY